MLSDARQELIKKIAFRDGEVIISKVAAELGVSFETVRRDINALCRQNILSKVHGGAVPVNITEHEGHYLKRKSSNTSVKKALGAYAVNEIKNAGVAFFSVGTTLEAVASESTILGGLSVITNSLPVAEIFGSGITSGSGFGRIALAGGRLNTDERFTFGTETRNQILRYRADVAVISAVGIDTQGIMCASSEEGEIIASMMKSADRVILVAESYKFLQKSVYRFSELDGVDEIITDNINKIPSDTQEAIKNNKISLRIAEI